MALDDDAYNELESQLQALEERGSELSDWERSFVGDQVKRFNEYAHNIRFSPKQWSIIQRIQQKLGILVSDRPDAD